MTVDELVFLIKSNTKPLVEGLSKADNEVKNFVRRASKEIEDGTERAANKAKSGGFSTFAGIFTAGLIAVNKVMKDYKAFGEYSVQVNKVAKSIGVATNAIQSFQKVAKLSGDNMGDLTGKMKGLQNSLYAFRTYGTIPEEQLIALSRLGMSTADIYDKNGKLRPIQSIAQIANKNAHRLGYDEQYASYLMQQAGLFSEGTAQKVYEGKFDTLIKSVEKTNIDNSTVAKGIEANTSNLLTEWTTQKTVFQAMSGIGKYIEAGQNFYNNILPKLDSMTTYLIATIAASSMGGSIVKALLTGGTLGSIGAGAARLLPLTAGIATFLSVMKAIPAGDTTQLDANENENTNWSEEQKAKAWADNRKLNERLANGGTRYTQEEAQAQEDILFEVSKAQINGFLSWHKNVNLPKLLLQNQVVPSIYPIGRSGMMSQPNITFNISANGIDDLEEQVKTRLKPTLFDIFDEYDYKKSEEGGNDSWRWSNYGTGINYVPRY